MGGFEPLPIRSKVRDRLKKIIMASMEGLKSRYLLRESKVARVLDDQPVALRITYSGASTSAPVISVITATSMTLTTSFGATVFTFATFSTLALLAAAINAGKGDAGAGAALGGFTARIMDALPSTITTASNIIVSAGLVASSVEGELVYDALIDTSTTKFLAYRVAYDRNVVSRKAINGHRVSLVDFVYNANVSAAEAGAVRIYEYNPIDGSTTLVWAATSVDSTGTAGATDLSFSTCPLTASEGREYIVMVMDTTSLTDSATNYLQVSFVRE